MSKIFIVAFDLKESNANQKGQLEERIGDFESQQVTSSTWMIKETESVTVSHIKRTMRKVAPFDSLMICELAGNWDGVLSDEAKAWLNEHLPRVVEED